MAGWSLEKFTESGDSGSSRSDARSPSYDNSYGQPPEFAMENFDNSTDSLHTFNDDEEELEDDATSAVKKREEVHQPNEEEVEDVDLGGITTEERREISASTAVEEEVHQPSEGTNDDDEDATKPGGAPEGFVVVETNFRLYAYSTSKLHCEILRLFSRVEYQLPNLIVGAITKESLYSAFDNGITGEQRVSERDNIDLEKTTTRGAAHTRFRTTITSFLQQNAHPRVAERAPSVPENVTDQIRLWETDLNRVEMVHSHFYDEFPSKDVFEAACNYARDNGGWLWEDSKKQRLVVKAEIHMQMREYLRRQK